MEASWLPTERAKGFPTGKTGTKAQVFLKEPMTAVFFEGREDKVG